VQLKERNGSRLVHEALESSQAHFVYVGAAIVLLESLADSKALYSRQAIKKYIQANNTTNAASSNVFDSQFNRALKNGVDKGEFSQPKGTSSVTSIPFLSSHIVRGFPHVVHLRVEHLVHLKFVDLLSWCFGRRTETSI